MLFPITSTVSASVSAASGPVVDRSKPARIRGWIADALNSVRSQEGGVGPRAAQRELPEKIAGRTRSITGALVANSHSLEAVSSVQPYPDKMVQYYAAAVSPEEVRAEARLLNELYGNEGKIFAAPSMDGRSILMGRVYGIPLDRLSEAQKPVDLPDKVLACVERMVEAGLFPDVEPSKYLYVQTTGAVVPADLQSAYVRGSDQGAQVDSFREGMAKLMRLAGRNVPDGKMVSFGAETTVEIPSDPLECSSRLPVQLDSLDQVRRDLERGAELSAREVRMALLRCLVINSDYEIVSRRSEGLILKALDELQAFAGGSYSTDSVPCELIHAFATKLADVRPRLAGTSTEHEL